MIGTLFVIVLLAPLAAASDLRIVERRYFAHMEPQDSRYFRKGDRQRFESRDVVGGRTKESFVYGPRSAVIYQCDLNRTVYLNLDTKRYLIEDFKPWKAAIPVDAPPREAAPKMPAVRYSSVRNIEETKEKKIFHGREAWLVRETHEGTSTLGTEVNKYSSTEETWYIELDAPMGCFKFPRGSISAAFLSPGGDPGEHKVIGSARRGYPIATKHVTKASRGSGSVYSSQVVEFSEQVLDPALFEIPADFAETHRWEEIAPTLRPRLRWWESVIVWFYRLTR